MNKSKHLIADEMLSKHLLVDETDEMLSKHLLLPFRQILHEAKSTLTLDKLVSSTRKYSSSMIDRVPSVHLDELTLKPWIGVNRLRTHGITSKSGWKFQIDFYGIDFSPSQDEDHPIPITYKKGQIFIPYISFHNTLIGVNCSCPAYRYNFAYANLNMYSAHIPGRLKKYKKKTRSPYKNPDLLPGGCKHILKGINILAKRGFFADKKSII